MSKKINSDYIDPYKFGFNGHRFYTWSCHKKFKNTTVDKLYKTEKIVNPDIEVTYSFNDHGYRTHSFNSRKDECYVALGSSDTIGLGQSEHNRWSNIIEEHTGVKTYNLGQGKGSADTITRTAIGWLKELNPSKVFVLWPPNNRYELGLEHNHKIVTLTPHEYEDMPDNLKNIYELYLGTNFNSLINRQRNEYTITGLCSDLDIELYSCDYVKFNHIDKQTARDGMHHGSEYQKAVANNFINMLDK